MPRNREATKSKGRHGSVTAAATRKSSVHTDCPRYAKGVGKSLKFDRLEYTINDFSDPKRHVELREPNFTLDRAIAADWSDQEWKTAAVCYLYHVCGFNLEMIGKAFKHPKGHITRLLVQGEQRIRALFPDVSEVSDVLSALQSDEK